MQIVQIDPNDQFFGGEWAMVVGVKRRNRSKYVKQSYQRYALLVWNNRTNALMVVEYSDSELRDCEWREVSTLYQRLDGRLSPEPEEVSSGSENASSA